MGVEMSPHDWPLRWRILILLNVSFYNFLGNTWSAGLSPVFDLIMKDFHCSQSDASDLSTFTLLALGISNLLALPLVSIIGQRYTILLSLVIFLTFNIWSAEATNYASLRNSRVIAGLAAGLVEALGPTMVYETFREHQLARAMVVYVGSLAAGSVLGPVIAGIIGEHLESWRWYVRILSVLIGANLLASIVMLPETSHMGLSGDAEVTENAEPQKLNCATIEDRGPTLPSPTEETPSMNFKREWLLRSFSTRHVYLKWSLALRRFVQPLQLLLAPQVLVTVYVFGCTIGWMVITSILLALIYAQPPLLWNAQSIGLLNLAPFLGLLIGLPCGGILADQLFIRSAKKGLGPSPASRLPVAIFGMLISPSGCLVLGYGLKNPGTWIQVCACWAMLAFGLTGSANVLLAYSVNSIPGRAGDIGVLINFMKNLLAFGVSYASLSWMELVGPDKQYATMAALLWFGYLWVLPIWFFSPALIRKTQGL
ncbi:unnamed protein product [Clonostachys rosea]|uniref:Major facilitator superfamily (MFS) profile domain-containing protein n=1 Tax=Bionectria ochroleuca TaxID=29856 RepID=A0ABY6UJ95_BIOOC|nr:unnamed protein product [Clonostachys rosea]